MDNQLSEPFLNFAKNVFIHSSKYQISNKREVYLQRELRNLTEKVAFLEMENEQLKIKNEEINELRVTLNNLKNSLEWVMGKK